MRLTPHGDPLLGVASKVCPINGTRKAYQTGADATAWRIETAEFDGSNPVTEAGHGAIWLRGGGGVWAVLGPGGVHVRGRLGRPPQPGDAVNRPDLPNDGILDVGPDGIVYVTNYQTGEDIRAYHPDAHNQPGGVRPVLTLSTAPILYDATGGPQVSALRGLRLAWLAGSVQTHGLPNFVARGEHVNSLRLAETPAGRVYIVERGSNWLMVRPIDSLDGWQVDGDGEHFFSPDLVALDDLWIVVGWSHTQGEGPEAGRTQDIDVTTPRAPLVRPTPPPVIEPPPVEPPVIEPEPPPVVEPPIVIPPTPQPEPPQPEQPIKIPWWRKVIEAILGAWWEGRK